MQSSTFVPLLSTFAFLAVTSVASAQTTAASPTAASVPKGKALAIFAPSPRYPNVPGPLGPRLARARATGGGVVLVEVDETTGRVISAKMEKSTGYKILDDAALEVFSRWRFKPGTRHKIRIPITFTNQIRPGSAGFPANSGRSGGSRLP